MPLGSTAFWGVVIPSAKVNLITNPSFELGSAGWGTLPGGGTVGTTSAFQAFGAWAGSVAPTSNGTAGIVGGTWQSGQGSDYTASVYVRGAVGIPYRFGVVGVVSGAPSGATLGSVTFTGGGTWQRYSVSYTEPTVGQAVGIYVMKNASNNTSAFYVDGAQAEAGSLTTYLDGAQPECAWLGGAHISQSSRPATARTGGSVVALVDLGFLVEESPGIGMPPVQNNSQSYAILDGDQFQRQRAAARPLTLTGAFLGTSWQNLHALRRALINDVKIDLAAQPAPSRLVYIGAGGTSFIDAVYQSGLEFAATGDSFVEQAAIQFQAFDPYWHAERDIGTTLGGRASIGSMNYLGWRDARGQWGTLGQFNGITVTGGTTLFVTALAYNPAGTLFIGGDFTVAGGTNARSLARYVPASNTFGSFGSSFDPGQVVRTLTLNPSGTLYIGGEFLGVNGSAGARFIAQWAGAFGTLVGGTPNGAVLDLAITNGGTLAAAGAFTTIGGTAGRLGAIWNGAAWGTLTGGTLGGGGSAMSVAVGLDGRLYFGGDFTSAGGTAAGSVAQWDGAFGTLGSAANSIVRALTVGPNGVLTVGGQFSVAGPGSALALAQWNGVGWNAIGSGLTQASGAPGTVVDVAVDPATGIVTATGSFSRANTIPVPDNLVRWTGGAFVPADVDLSSGVVRTLLQAPNGTLYIGGNFNGTAQAATLATLVNPGMAQAYPTIQLNNPTAGTIRVYQIVNTTTGDAIYFNLALLAGETATLALAPGSRAITSDFRGNILSSILPGSNLATWRLLPGTNTVSFFADSGSITASLWFRPRHWSADGGTI